MIIWNREASKISSFSACKVENPVSFIQSQNLFKSCELTWKCWVWSLVFLKVPIQQITLHWYQRKHLDFSLHLDELGPCCSLSVKCRYFWFFILSGQSCQDFSLVCSELLIRLQLLSLMLETGADHTVVVFYSLSWILAKKLVTEITILLMNWASLIWSYWDMLNSCSRNHFREMKNISQVFRIS